MRIPSALLALSLTLPSLAQPLQPAETLKALSPQEREYFMHVTTLTNPFFEGRAPGSRGNELAAEFVEFYFRKTGLGPAFPTPKIEGEGMVTGSTPFASFRQGFSTGRETVPAAQAMSFTAGGSTVELVAGKDFAVRGVSGSGTVSGPLVFVGYGLEEGKDGYNSFEGMTGGENNKGDLSGKIALVLRTEPLNDEGKSRWSESGAFSTRRYTVAARLRAVAERKAAGVLLVYPPGVSDPEGAKLQDTKSSTQGTMMSIPVVNLRTDAAARLVSAAGGDLMALRKAADEKGGVTDLAGATVSIEAKVERRPNKADNVGGVLEGRGALKDEFIVIGAHLDHVGYGLFGSRADARGQLHPGADDNASGTAGLVMLARLMADGYAALPADASVRSVMFVAFNAEEGGLIGSRHFVKESPLEASRIYAMLNMDMIGRARRDSQGRPKVEAAGVGTAKGFAELLGPIFDASGLAVKTLPGGQGPSDHASFYKGNIPVLHVFTGLHDQYHMPSDTYEHINPAGAVKVVGLVKNIADMLVRRTETLEFTPTRGGDIDYAEPTDDMKVVDLSQVPAEDLEALRKAREEADAAREAAKKTLPPAAEPAAEPGRRARTQPAPAEGAKEEEAAPPSRGGMKVRFGIAPGEYEEGHGGLLVGEVYPGTSAAEAGLKTGDVITKWNDATLSSVRDWMPLLMKANPGDKVTLTVKRGVEVLTLQCTLKGRD